MEIFSAGKLGELFTALAFASALVAMLSFLFAEQRGKLEKEGWEQLGVGAFALHIISIFGIVATLFTMIYQHQYGYHYVWAHSSNELPVYYMISCFWEGQEGSFLLWCFWHSVLGGILLFSKNEWRNLVIAIIASVELILSSMLLGVYLNGTWVTGIYLTLILLPGLYLAFQYFTQPREEPLRATFQLASIFVALILLVLIFRDQMGFWSGWNWSDLLAGKDGWIFGLVALGILSYLVLYVLTIRESARADQPFSLELLGGLALIGAGVGAMMFEAGIWKVGSTPFILLKSVFATDEVYTTNPGFVPTNGNGLNPLLQNYWMVIHPPTLFLGFSSTVVPFAYVMAGLIKGKYHEWIKPAMPWATFSVMILGIGIIMGGYWAYETLNFGGYWNWDPVENSSLVPWLCGVASLHAMLIYRKSKAYLKLTMILIIGTFLLVLYSTFLTRSGILGETSVHTFTDLGLSGQLLVLVWVYVAAVVVLFVRRWTDIPQREDESKVWSAEFMLFIGVLIFIFSGLVIIFATSLPVFNELFGTNMAPPPEVQLFYYQWTVWFGILFGVVSGIGQFLWWKRAKKKSLADALFRPFLMAVVAGSAILIGLMVIDKDFAYDPIFADYINPEANGGGFFNMLMGYIKFGVVGIADELLIFSSLFGLFANLDVLFSLVHKNRKGLKIMGGTIVHIGFAFMLLGMLFSSGYDEVISKNLRPAELASLPEQEQVDNVPLPRGYKTQIKDFNVTYIGKKEAKAPVSDLEVIEENALFFKLRFDDVTGDRFAVVQQRAPFIKRTEEESSTHPTVNKVGTGDELEGELDMELLEELLNKNLDAFEPEHINNRTLFGLRFESLKDPEKTFELFPEAEVNEKMKTILPHPGRKVYWNRDIYVYTSSLPDPEKAKPQYYNLAMKVGDSTELGNTKLKLTEIKNLTNRDDLKEFEVAAAAHIQITYRDNVYWANPIYLIDGNKPGMINATVDEVGMDFVFVGVQPEANLINIQIKHIDPQEDFVVIKAISKPFINLLWLGTFILTAGFLLSIYRRVQETRKK